MSSVPENGYGENPVEHPQGTQFEKVSNQEVPLTLKPEQEKRLWRKVDLRLMPILSVMYLLAFMDRGNIGNAKLDGIVQQLDLTGNRFNIALTMFFVSYCTFECPANLALLIVRPSRWLPGIMVAWGIVMTLMGLVKTYPQLVAVRFCLGVAEAGLFPGVAYYLTLWYPIYQLQYRIGLFFGAATVAGAFSGLLAFALGYMGGLGNLEGWSWIFIIEGLLTVVVGFIAFFLIIDFPTNVTFLTPEEKAYLVWRRKYDRSTDGGAERFAFRHVIAVFTDWQIYAYMLVSISNVCPLYGITFFLPTIIDGFGYTTAISQLLTVPPYVIAAAVLLICAHYSDKLKIRSPFIYGGSILLLIGYSINISNASNGAKYFGTFLIVTGSYAPVPGIVAWLSNNIPDHHQRAVAIALQVGIASISGIIAVNIYRTQDSPRFILGHGLELMFAGIGTITVPILALSYRRINHKRDVAMREAVERGEKIELTEQELRELGNRAPDFRYTL